MKGLSVLIPVGGAIEEDPWRLNAFNWLHERYKALMPDAELCFGTSDQEPFNRAQARNDAYAQSTGEILLVADADTIFNVAQIVRAMTMIRETGAPWVIPYDELRYYNLSQQATVYVVENAEPAAEIPEPDDPAAWDHKITSWAGLIVLPRTAWQAVGGYDQRFIGWGYDDNAFRFALDHRVGTHRRVKGDAGYTMHLWHPAPEEDCFGQPNIKDNRDLCRKYEKGILP